MTTPVVNDGQLKLIGMIPVCSEEFNDFASLMMYCSVSLDGVLRGCERVCAGRPRSRDLRADSSGVERRTPSASRHRGRGGAAGTSASSVRACRARMACRHSLRAAASAARCGGASDSRKHSEMNIQQKKGWFHSSSSTTSKPSNEMLPSFEMRKTAKINTTTVHNTSLLPKGLKLK
jgi:hypothetical protein